MPLILSNSIFKIIVKHKNNKKLITNEYILLEMRNRK